MLLKFNLIYLQQIQYKIMPEGMESDLSCMSAEDGPEIYLTKITYPKILKNYIEKGQDACQKSLA